MGAPRIVVHFTGETWKTIAWSWALVHGCYRPPRSRVVVDHDDDDDVTINDKNRCIFLF